MSDSKIVTLLNNGKRNLVFGDPSRGQQMDLASGATDIPRAVFDAVHDASDGQGQGLRAALKQGTLTIIDTQQPLDPANIAYMKPEDCVRSASRFGDVETRARLAQRWWILRGDPSEGVPQAEHGHLFVSLIGENHNFSPSDPVEGWKAFLRPQQHMDGLLACMAADAKARNEHNERIAAVAEFARAGAAAQKGGV